MRKNLAGNCCRCGKNARMAGIEYCRQCLCDVVEKRAKKELSGTGIGGISSRGAGSSNAGYRIAIVCGSKSSLQCVAASYLVKKLCRPGFGFGTVTPGSALQMPKNAAVTAVILAKCADELATEFLETVISMEGRQQPQQFMPLQKQQKQASAANIFKSITEKELRLYANIKNLKYAESTGGWLKQKILELNGKYPGTIEALAKAGSSVKRLVDK
ncbi:hypothetical protein HYU16_01905 [Candidatus Woesearchaeota archaeon]|nr:hypothetical protein [Candidatus Woesearchaeota archaeon]MBI2550182.1 hypothetical protein [Candidatus Woesearchaeota archaeon]